MAQARQPQQQQQPVQQFSSQSFSPPASSPSPNSSSGGVAPPPSKRPRLSPLPQSHSQSHSPHASPSFNAMQLPQTQMNGTPMTVGAMGPPSRPADKATDAAELTDVLASSGIDLKNEESILTSSYSSTSRGQHLPQLPPLGTSFTSQPSTPNTVSASASFNELPQIKPMKQESFSTEPTVSFKDPNGQTRENSSAARRAQYQLNDPFLLTKLLEQKLQKRAFDLGVRIPSEGLFHPAPGRPQPIEVSGPDGSSVVRVGQTIVNQEAPLVDILNILSISCEERLRGVVDYSSTLSRSRRAHSHGTVPAEWKEPAQPLGASSATSKKRSALEALASRESSLEEERAAKRAKRSANAILGEGAGARSDSVDVTGSAPSTPIGEKAPSFDRKSMTKKEAKKMIDAKASEVQQHQQSVETARLATSSMLSGRMFGTKKSYSWLKPGPSASGFSSPARPAPSTPTATPDKPSRAGETAPGPTKRRLGTWREDSDQGAGIQVRDILFMLDVDGRGIKHVQRGCLKDPKEDRGG